MTPSPAITLAAGVFIAFGLIFVSLTWRTIRSMWRNHGSVDRMRKRQLDEALRGELMYRAAAEQSAAIADGYAATVARLSGTQP